jgi:hypothetical protein
MNSQAHRFPLGQVVITPAAQALLEQAGVMPQALLLRHHQGDWGDVCVDDACANDHALAQGGRLFSAYNVGAHKVWIITEADKLYTNLLIPDDY